MFHSLVSTKQLSNIYIGFPLHFFSGSRLSNTVLSRESCHSTRPDTFSIYFYLNVSSILYQVYTNRQTKNHKKLISPAGR